MIKCKTTNGNVKDKPARISGRRSSKPLMEKRRRARINTCLEILKSYVLKETTENLKQTKQTTANNTKATTDDAIVTTENIEQFLISELKDNKKSILKVSLSLLFLSLSQYNYRPLLTSFITRRLLIELQSG